MRTKETLLYGFKEIQTLCQYLYMDETNYIEFDNGMTVMRVRMSEDGDFLAKNTRFPNAPELLYNDIMSVSNMLNIIDILKDLEPRTEGCTFISMWDEIKQVVADTLSINFQDKVVKTNIVSKCIKCGRDIPISTRCKYLGYCKECFPKVKNYVIGADKYDYMDILGISLRNLECKHVVSTVGDIKDKKLKVIDMAYKANYPQIQWGYFSGNKGNGYHKEYIENMKGLKSRVVRIVLTKNHVWCDNTHTAISFINEIERNVTIDFVPSYIVDLRDDNVAKVVGNYDILNVEVSEILKTIRKSLKLKYLEDTGGRDDVSWTVGDLMDELYRK